MTQNSTTRYAALLLVTLLLSACASSINASAPERFAGHWTLGAVFSVFETTDGRAFHVLADDMPPSAYKFLTSQRSHFDKFSESGSSVSAYYEVIGRLLPYEGNLPGSAPSQRLHVERVLRMEKARPEYLAEYQN